MRVGGGSGGGKGAEYKVTSHVYFIPVDPIKVPIIISDVFRCNMFDLVSDILWSHICLVNLAAVAPLHKNIKRRCVPRSTPIPGGKILPAIPRDGNSLSPPPDNSRISQIYTRPWKIRAHARSRSLLLIAARNDKVGRLIFKNGP